MGRTIYRKKENRRVAPCFLHRQDIIVFSWLERKTEVEQQEYVESDVTEEPKNKKNQGILFFKVVLQFYTFSI